MLCRNSHGLVWIYSLDRNKGNLHYSQRAHDSLIDCVAIDGSCRLISGLDQYKLEVRSLGQHRLGLENQSRYKDSSILRRSLFRNFSDQVLPSNGGQHFSLHDPICGDDFSLLFSPGGSPSQRQGVHCHYFGDCWYNPYCVW